MSSSARDGRGASGSAGAGGRGSLSTCVDPSCKSNTLMISGIHRCPGCEAAYLGELPNLVRHTTAAVTQQRTPGSRRGSGGRVGSSTAKAGETQVDRVAR